MADAFDPATLEFYAKEAPVYVGRSPDGSSRYLEGFLERLEPGARILELGSGYVGKPGPWVRVVAQKG